jgi:nicotinamidase-related amidase
MSSHYAPYSGQYKVKKLVHRGGAPPTDNSSVNSDTKSKRDRSVLLILDVQNDFLPGGALPVMYRSDDKGNKECDPMINSINEMILADVFDYYVYTQDVHQPDHVSFASIQNRDPFDVVKLEKPQQSGKSGSEFYEQVLWPEHCVLGKNNGIALSEKLITPIRNDEQFGTGSQTFVDVVSKKMTPGNSVVSMEEIKSDIKYPDQDEDSLQDNESEIDTLRKTLLPKSYLLWKGFDKNVDSYSAFKDIVGGETGLRRFLTRNNIKNVYVCGLARDFGAWWTAADASSYKYTSDMGKTESEFSVHFVLDATMPIPGSIKLPDYDVNGKAPHQLAIKEIGVDKVYADLMKHHVEGNRWAQAFLEPYGVKPVSWKTAVDDLETVKHLRNKNDQPSVTVSQEGGSILRRSTGQNSKPNSKQKCCSS